MNQCPVVNVAKFFIPSVFSHWKNWTWKEKKEWILSLLVSGGTDYADEIEDDRVKKLK